MPCSKHLETAQQVRPPTTAAQCIAPPCPQLPSSSLSAAASCKTFRAGTHSPYPGKEVRIFSPQLGCRWQGGPWRQAGVTRGVVWSGGTRLRRTAKAWQDGARQRPRPRRCRGNRSTAGEGPGAGRGRLLGNSRAGAKVLSGTRPPLPEE